MQGTGKERTAEEGRVGEGMGAGAQGAGRGRGAGKRGGYQEGRGTGVTTGVVFIHTSHLYLVTSCSPLFNFAASHALFAPLYHHPSRTCRHPCSPQPSTARTPAAPPAPACPPKPSPLPLHCFKHMQHTSLTCSFAGACA